MRIVEHQMASYLFQTGAGDFVNALIDYATQNAAKINIATERKRPKSNARKACKVMQREL